jgi:poly [ADP-ribose] polymerase 1
LKDVEIKMEEKTGSLGNLVFYLYFIEAGVTLCIAGKLSKNQKDFKKIIESHGGELITSMNAVCDYLISNDAELKKKTAKIEMALEQNIPILNEDFIHDSVKSKEKIQDLEKYYIFKPMNKRKIVELTETKESPSKKTKRTYKIKGKAAVDPDCEIGDDLHVLELNNDIYSSNLNMTDISRGSNSYYVLQVLEHDNKKEFHLFRKWGRLGTDVGSHKIEEFEDRDSAIYYFEKLYFEKTGNEWSDRNNFVKKPSKFYPVDISYGEDDDEITKLIEQQMKSDYKGKLDQRVIDVISLFFDTKEMTKTLAEMEIDTKKMPLGKLSKKTIAEGFETLCEIEKSLKESKDDLLTLSNKFYTIIPHVFQEKSIPIIDSLDALKSKIEMLESLRDMETATSLLKSSSNEEDKEHIHDSNYKKLKTEIIPIEKEEKEFKMILEYVKNTHGKTHRE